MNTYQSELKVKPWYELGRAVNELVLTSSKFNVIDPARMQGETSKSARTTASFFIILAPVDLSAITPLALGPVNKIPAENGGIWGVAAARLPKPSGFESDCKQRSSICRSDYSRSLHAKYCTLILQRSSQVYRVDIFVLTVALDKEFAHFRNLGRLPAKTLHEIEIADRRTIRCSITYAERDWHRTCHNSAIVPRLRPCTFFDRFQGGRRDRPHGQGFTAR